MKKDTIFFDKEGLTTTSANHIANMAKEAYRFLEFQLKDAVFFTTCISILGSANSSTLKEGVDNSFLDNLDKSLTAVAKYKSLIAWLREAIKAKERLIKEASNLSETSIAEVLGITIPKQPEKYTRLTEDDVVSTWGIKQRNRYYYLDTICATIGGYMHPSNTFFSAKDELAKVMTQRNTIQGSGRDTVIYSRIPTVSMEKVEEVFFKLQDKYRSYQAELNSLKHQIKVALQEDDREKSQKEIEEAKLYENECKTVNAQISAYRKETIQAMQSLKIVIPDSLKDIYEHISEMGKTK